MYFVLIILWIRKQTSYGYVQCLSMQLLMPRTAHLTKSRPETEIFFEKMLENGDFWCILVNCTSHFSFGAALLVCGPI